MSTHDSAALQTAANDCSTDPLEELDYTEKTGKRATHEALEVSPGEGYVEVTNASHADPSEHAYRVDVLDGVPVRCECPADEYHDGACKHRVRVALAPAVIEAAAPELVTDGGQIVDAGDDAEILSDERPEDCMCWDPEAPISCWPCYLAGFREPNPDAPVDEEEA